MEGKAPPLLMILITIFLPLRSFGRRERLLKHMKSHGIGVMPAVRPQYHQPKKEFKKEPEFNAGKVGGLLIDYYPKFKDVDFLDAHSSSMPHGVFGDQTNQLLRMIAQKGPISPDQLGMAQAPPAEQVFANPEVARALSNPDIVRAFSNPEVVKAFALSPPKKSATSPGGSSLSQATLTTVQAAALPAVTRGPDIANSPSVPPELSKLPSGFSIFPVVASSGSGQVVAGTSQETAVVPGGGQVCVSNNGNTYYQAAPSYVAAAGVPHRAELTTIPMAAWPGWHMTAQPVNMRSPAKVEPGDSKYWEPTTAYFRAPLP